MSRLCGNGVIACQMSADCETPSRRLSSSALTRCGDCTARSIRRAAWVTVTALPEHAGRRATMPFPERDYPTSMRAPTSP